MLQQINSIQNHRYNIEKNRNREFFYNDFCEIVIDSMYFSSFKFRQFKINLNYNSTHFEKNYNVNTINAIKKARNK